MSVNNQRSTLRIAHCEVCGSEALEDVLDLGTHPLCDDLIPVGSDRASELYPIEISFCARCRTAHQRYQVPKRVLFPDSYHYRARLTADVLSGMRQLVTSCADMLGELAGIRVLDIGCNDGSLLSIFAESGARTFGIEPTGAADDARAAGHEVYKDYLSTEVAERLLSQHGQPDLITFTNVFAHIEDLQGVLAAVRALMSPTTTLVIENHYLGAVLDRYQFDTFYHEHPRTYSLSSFTHIAQSLGASIVGVEFPSRYGGNIRVAMRLGANGKATPAVGLEGLTAAESDFGSRLASMARKIPVWRDDKRARLSDLIARHGPLPAKAFPGRAAILVRLLGLDEQMVSRVHEKPGSMKLGHYVPATRIPIVSDDEFATRKSTAAPLLNFAWHISDEIRGYMKRQGFDGEIIDIFSPSEFEQRT
jgi:SAM-dependent methyltransferase